MATSTCGNNEFNFTWKIRHFNLFRPKEEYMSPFFNTGKPDITYWCLTFRGVINKYDFYLIRKGICDHTGIISYKIEIVDKNEQILYSTECDKCSFSLDEEHNEHCEIIFKDINIINVTTLTVRCILTLQETIINNVYACQSETELEAKRFFHKWILKNFSKFDQVSKVSYCPEVARFHITLFRNLLEEFVTIEVQAMGGIHDRVLQCGIVFRDANGVVKDSSNLEYFIDNDIKTWEIPPFIKTSENDIYIKDNTIYVLCLYKIPTGVIWEDVKYIHDEDSISLPSTNMGSLDNLQENVRRWLPESSCIRR